MPRLRVAITGASGMLGTAMLHNLHEDYEVFALARSMGYCHADIHWHLLDLCDYDQLTQWLLEVRPDVVIHSAAITNVDLCEQESIQADKLHAGVTAVIAKVISKWQGRLIYISTDAVFNGQKDLPYVEEDPPGPNNVYGMTKLQGEQIALSYAHALVLRTTIIGWRFAARPNLVEWIVRGLIEEAPLTLFTDVIFTPIHVQHFTEVLLQILAMREISGLFHVTGGTALSKYDFAIKLGKVFSLATDKIQPVQLASSCLVAKRANNMAMTNTKVSQLLSYPLPGIDIGIEYLKNEYDNGLLARIKQKVLPADYRFWEV